MNDIMMWVLFGILILDVIGNGILISYKRKEKTLRQTIYDELKEIIKEGIK